MDVRRFAWYLIGLAALCSLVAALSWLGWKTTSKRDAEFDRARTALVKGYGTWEQRQLVDAVYAHEKTAPNTARWAGGGALLLLVLGCGLLVGARPAQNAP